MQFEELHLITPLLRALQDEGYESPTPIQAQAIPHVLAGRDLLGCAQTGTGKTAAFALPILQRLSELRSAEADQAQGPSQQVGQGRPGQNSPRQQPRRAISVLVLSPTRELAAQIGDSFAAYGRHLRLRHAVIYGGVGQDKQVQAIRAGVDILVATPGRLLDLMNQKLVRLDEISILVLDEADRMLDMGFIHDVRRILGAVPKKRQSLLFSATLPPDIRDLSRQILVDPAYVEVTPVATTAEKISQKLYFVDTAKKRPLLEHLLGDANISRALIFTRTKHGANRLVKQLGQAQIGAEAIHGNKSQGARTRALQNFKSGATRLLVATDIAARGIDVDGVSHVINYDLPEVAESYVHRIGRTARAGASGIAISFCDQEERHLKRDIERLIRMNIEVVADHPFVGSGGSEGTATFGDASEGSRSSDRFDRSGRHNRPQGQRRPFGRPGSSGSRPSRNGRYGQQGQGNGHGRPQQAQAGQRPALDGASGHQGSWSSARSERPGQAQGTRSRVGASSQDRWSR